MLRNRSDAPADLTRLPKFSPQDLSSTSLRDYRLLMATRNPDHGLNQLPDENFLLSAGAAALSEEQGQICLTAAGLLLLGKQPALVDTFPAYRLDYEEDIPDGLRLSSAESSWSGNLFDFYCKVSQRLHRLSSEIAPSTPDLEHSMSEAVINAIIHTDYVDGQGLRILYRPDALIVRNSGLLRVPPEAAKEGGQSDPRNGTLTHLFALIGVASGSGKGLKGIYATWAKQGFHPPSLSESFGPDLTTLRLPLPRRPKDGLSQQLLEQLTRFVSATPTQLSEHLGVSPILVQKGLSLLSSDGLVTVRELDGQRFYSLRS